MTKPTLFRVIREKVDGQTVRVLLEPYRDEQHVEVTEGDEFITGALNSDPWAEPTSSSGDEAGDGR